MEKMATRRDLGRRDLAHVAFATTYVLYVTTLDRPLLQGFWG
jgi:hypothetical protein